MTTFLVVSPHPDDGDFGCGGTVAKLTQEKNEVQAAIISDGSQGSHVIGMRGKRLITIREKEQKAAAAILGVSAVHFLGEKDGAVQNTARLRKKLVELMRKIRPEAVITYDPFLFRVDRAGIAHRDHRHTGEAVFDAIYPDVGSTAFFPELVRKGLKPHQVKEIWFFGSREPNHFIDIASTIDQKIKAILCHQSQVEDKANLPQRVKEWAEKASQGKEMKYAEAFRVLQLE